MKSTQIYVEVTARTVTGQVYDWLNELVERFGDDRVSSAIQEDGQTGKPLEKLLGRVRDRLAREDAMRRPHSRPIVLAKARLLAIVRGEEQRPDGAMLWETQDLSAAEYAEVMKWGGRRLGLADWSAP